MSDSGQDYTIAIRTSGSEETPPNSERVKGAFSRVGYSLEDSIADLIDNSIDAGATDVLVRFLYDAKKVRRTFIVDNGKGMSENILRQAMRFGSTLQHRKEDLGKYGIGLKSASFGQCHEFAVVTRQSGKTSGRRWASSSFDKDWLCETLEPNDCSLLLGADWATLDLKEAGTIVVWDQLTCLQTGAMKPAEAISGAIASLHIHLGLVFHRFLTGKRIRLHLDSQLATGPPSIGAQSVQSLDPFSYPKSGALNYPKDFRTSLTGAGELVLHAHIWPKKSRELGYRLGGGVAARQGFYFYRNDRLIQAGGWNGYRDDTEPHLSLARVSVDLPVSSAAFDVHIQKSKVIVPRGFADAVERAESGSAKFPDYINKAVEVYRKQGQEDEADFPLVPWLGLSSTAREWARRELAPDASRVRKVSFIWTKLDRGLVFSIDSERHRILLNEIHRKSILNGGRRSKNDAQAIKALIFLLMRDHFDHKIVTKARRKDIEASNQILLRCLE